MALEESQTILLFPFVDGSTFSSLLLFSFSFFYHLFILFSLFHCAGTHLFIMYKLTFVTMVLAATELSRAIPIPVQAAFLSDNGSLEQRERIEQDVMGVRKMEEDAKELLNQAWEAHQSKDDTSTALTIAESLYGYGAADRIPEIQTVLEKFQGGTFYIHDSKGEAAEDHRPIGQHGPAWTKPGSDGDFPTVYLSNDWHHMKGGSRRLQLVDMVAPEVAEISGDLWKPSDPHAGFDRVVLPSVRAGIDQARIRSGGGNLPIEPPEYNRLIEEGTFMLPDEWIKQMGRIHNPEHNKHSLMGLLAMAPGCMSPPT
ncbi:hypothetical protein CPB86DRAFT_177720 [Serendipita vermifera]|nr:hypothetical protein CPB86DRAFT_177720 [Serendipita vermifera]